MCSARRREARLCGEVTAEHLGCLQLVVLHFFSTSSSSVASSSMRSSFACGVGCVRHSFHKVHASHEHRSNEDPVSPIAPRLWKNVIA